MAGGGGCLLVAKLLDLRLTASLAALLALGPAAAAAHAKALQAQGAEEATADAGADGGAQESLLRPIRVHGCPGVVLEATADDEAWWPQGRGRRDAGRRDGSSATRAQLLSPFAAVGVGLPAVLRVRAPRGSGGDDDGGGDDADLLFGDGGGGGFSTAKSTKTSALPSTPPPTALPPCIEGSFPGRWLPTDLARPLVTNGANIPRSRLKYWVPFGCRPTFWDIAALRRVAAAGGDTGPCGDEAAAETYPSIPLAPEGTPAALSRKALRRSTIEGGGEGGAAQNLSPPPVSLPCARLLCHMPSLERVVFTGSSTSAVLFSGMRRHVLGESKEASRRDKEADHARSEAGIVTLASTEVQLAPGIVVRWSMEETLMSYAPKAAGDGSSSAHQQRRAEDKALRFKQMAELLNGTRPTSLLLHMGLHELCGAYGPHWYVGRGEVRRHAPCASRLDLAEAYLDYREALQSLHFPAGQVKHCARAHGGVLR